ncbi:PREDICTED: uncharacterized protein LOC104406679 [Nestor notabilis]|uniref:uncharacterized protein LOC104406679 n=1 Tax=Nestor notabilis TaxID=176057 RepID=UPI000523D443|nr:PREDICTED: uncharacterized protein LOC104406679 [Nestor notabilis]
MPAGTNISSVATSMGIAPGNNVPPGSNVLLNPSVDHQNQGLGEPDGDIEVTEEMLLKEALRLFGMSEDMEGVIQDAPSSVTMTEDPGVTIGKEKTLVPAAPELPNSIPGYENIEGVSAGINISRMAMSTGTPPDTNIPQGSNIPPSPSVDHQNPGFGEPGGDIEVTEEMLLKEALRLFGMSEDMEGVIQDGPGSIAMPEDHGDTIGKGRTDAPDLLSSIPSNKNIKGVSAEPDIPSAATSVGTTLGINIPPGSDVPPSPSADPHNQGLGDLKDSLVHYEEVPLEEALRFFSCYEDNEGVSREGPSSSPMPEDPGGTGTDIPLYDFTSLSLPEELLTCDYSVLEKAKVIQSFEDISTIEMEPYGWWADLGMDVEPSQPAGAEMRGTK